VPQSDKQQPILHRREMSTESISSSDYSLDSIADDGLINFTALSKQSPERPRRSATRSEEGRDRHRLPFIQSDPSHEETPRAKHRSDNNYENNSPANLRSRRGFEGQSLVTSLDTAANTCDYLTPPSTAPVSGGGMMLSGEPSKSTFSGHSRSQSDVVNIPKPLVQGGQHQRKSSRDVGIVGIAGAVRRNSQSKDEVKSTTPIFQQPHTRPVTPGEDYSDASDSKTGPDTPPTIPKGATSFITAVGFGQQDNLAQPPTMATISTQPLTVRKKSARATVPEDAVQQTPSPPFSPVSTPTSPDLNYQPGMSRDSPEFLNATNIFGFGRSSRDC
jgi:hypothetical protein